ncbi:MAG TPA: acyl-CoA dehydrogenase family protein [Desulfatiglandales bacterium]|nr:acyl-CoA dehydrogenase family protein [Desulfatiglandales bacterium]
MNFDLTEEEKMLRDLARKYAEKEVKPIADEVDDKGEFPMELYKKAGELGLLGSFIPEKYGGGGMGFMSRAIIDEEISRVLAGFGVSVQSSSLYGGNNLMHLGTEEQKEKYLPGIASGDIIACWALTEPDVGSDAFGIKTNAVKDGDYYIINGSKTFITNAPVADMFIVIVKTSKEERSLTGATAFILERGMKGLSTSQPLKKLGVKSSPTGEITFEDVRVHKSQILGKEGEGFKGMLEHLDIERILTAALYYGLAQACLEDSIAYANQRVQFNSPISKFQLVKEKIANMITGIELARTYTYKGIWMAEQGKNITLEASIAKYFSSEVAMQSALDAVQIFGGYGLIKEYPVERYLRDAKLFTIGGGTSEIQKLVLAREAYKLYG